MSVQYVGEEELKINADTLDGSHAKTEVQAGYIPKWDQGNVLKATNINLVPYAANVSQEGWYRVFNGENLSSLGQNIILNIARNFYNSNPETYQFAISTVFDNKVSITQLSGHINVQRIPKIRVLTKNNAPIFIDIYYNYTNVNAVSISGMGRGTFGHPTLSNDIPDGYTSTEFTPVNGFKTDSINTNSIGSSIYILPNGRVKVGTTSLSTYNPQFDVLYDSTTNEGRVGIMCRTDQNEAMYGCFIPSRGWKFGVKNNDFIFWNGGGGDVAKITEAAGNLLLKGSTGSLSDIRVKSDIEPLQNRGFLQPKTYIKDGESQIGFIAQEVKELYPELVLEDSNGYLSLSYGNITAVLQAQIIELKSIIDKQQECIDTLKNEINLLKEKWE